MPSSTRYRLLFLLLLGVAIGLRLWQLDRLPPGFHFDEAFEGLEAWRILTDPTYRPLFLLGNFGVPPLNAYANALMFGLFTWVGGSAGPTAMRLTAAVFGVMGVVVLYGLAHELRHVSFSRARPSLLFPLFAAATLALMRWHIHFSRMGIEPIIVPLLWSAATALFLQGRRTGRWLSFVGSGVVLAAGMYTYQGAWIIPFLMIPTFGWLLFRGSQAAEPTLATEPHRDEPPCPPRRVWLGAGLTAVIALLLVAPLGWFVSQHLDLILLRPAQLSIVGSTTSPADNSVGGALWATAKMFGPFGAPGDSDPRRNVPGLPALSFWLALPFYAGLVLALRWIAQPAYAIPFIGLIGLLLPGVFSEYAPHFHRILGAAAPVALCCGLGLDWLWRQQPRRSTVMRWAVILLLLAGGITESYNYFVRWARLPDLYYAFDVGLWQVGQLIAAQPSTTPVYLTPRAADHATLAFAWRARSPGRQEAQHDAPITFDGRAIFPLTAQAAPTDELYAVIEHEDFRTRLLLPGLFPTAEVVQEFTDAQGNVYARVYRRLAGTEAQRPPQQPLMLTLGDGIDFLGYDVQPAALKAGDILYLQLHWRVTATPRTDWTVFTHLLQHDGNGPVTLIAGHDSRPGNGSLPTTRWQTGWRILDEYQIALPSDLAAGDYELAIGLYQPSGEQLPATGSGIGLGKVHID